MFSFLVAIAMFLPFFFASVFLGLLIDEGAIVFGWLFLACFAFGFAGIYAVSITNLG